VLLCDSHAEAGEVLAPALCQGVRDVLIVEIR
jgi:hypothetical protein